MGTSSPDRNSLFKHKNEYLCYKTSVYIHLKKKLFCLNWLKYDVFVSSLNVIILKFQFLKSKL